MLAGDCASVSRYPVDPEPASAAVVKPVDCGQAVEIARDVKPAIRSVSQAAESGRERGTESSMARSPVSGCASSDVSVLPATSDSGGSPTTVPAGVVHAIDVPIVAKSSTAE